MNCFTTGINQINNDRNVFHIYTNPGGGIFSLNQNKNKKVDEIKIYNVIGEMVASFESSFSSIYISNQPMGIYYVKILSVQKYYFMTLVLEYEFFY